MVTDPRPTHGSLAADAGDVFDLPTSSAPPRIATRPAPRSNVLCISSESLLAGAMEVQIEHRGSLYRLKQTSLGKLILTK